jgi:AraC-like DNA-binding protein
MEIGKINFVAIVFVILHIFAQSGLWADKWDSYFALDRIINNDEQFLRFQEKLQAAHSDREKMELLNYINYLSSELPKEKYIVFPQLARKIAIKLGDRKAEVEALHNLAVGYYNHKNFLQSLDTHFQCRKLCTEIGDCRGVSFQNIEIANLFQFCFSDFATALIYYTQAEKSSRDCRFAIGLIRSLNNIGDIYLTWGESVEAARFFVAAIKISEQNERYIPFTASIKANLCEVYIMLDEFTQARKLAFQALALYQKISNPYGISRFHTLLGKWHQKQGQNDQALAEFIQAKNTTEAIQIDARPKYKLAEILADIGEIHSLKFEYVQAISYFNQAREYQQEINEQRGMAHTLRLLGTTHIRMNDLPMAGKYLQKALDICQSNNFLLELKEVYKEMEVLVAAKKDTAGELRFRKLYDDTREKIHGTRVTSSILAILQKYEEDKLIAEITRMKKSKIKFIWLYGLMILLLALLLAFLVFNSQRIKNWAFKLLALKDSQIAENKSQLEMLRAKLAELAKAGKDDKYLNSNLSDDQAQDILKKLIHLMEKKKIYLDCDLSLASLAGQLNVNSAYLSQVINEIFDKNFNDFISCFRIEEIKKMFADERNDRYSILDIALHCGFNSKTAFNRTFKRHMEMTPKQYRDRKK